MRNRHLSRKLLTALLAASMVTSSFPVQALAEAVDLPAEEPALEVTLDEGEQASQSLDEMDEQASSPAAEESVAEAEDDDAPAELAEQMTDAESTDEVTAEFVTDDLEESPADEPGPIDEDIADQEAASPVDEPSQEEEDPSAITEEDAAEDVADPILTAQATAADLKNSKIWIKQTNINGWGTCTVCSAAMLLRRAAILNGKAESYWLGITEKAMVNNSAVWAGDAGLYSNFTAYGMTVKQVWTTFTSSTLKSLLDKHPEGLVVYNGSHAVLLTDYTGDKFYCADPAYGDRRLLTSAASNVRVGTITSYWYVSSKVSPVEPSGTNVTSPNSNTVYDIPARYYSLRCKADPTKAVEIKGASTASGAAAQLNVFERTATQLFVINPSDISGAYTLRNSATTNSSSAQLLMVKGASTTNQTAIVQATTNGSNAQKWYIEKNTDGTYSIRNVNSGLYLDIQGGGANNGTVISQWKPTGATPPTSSRFYLVPANCTLWNVTLSDPNATYEYTGSPIDPGVTAWAAPTCPNFQLVEGVDYALTLSNNTNAGTATYRIEEKVNSHEQTGTFKIVAASIAKASVSSIAPQAFTGQAIKPKPTLELNGKALVEGTDYTLSYANNINAGTATITVTGIGNYQGKITTTFQIAGSPRDGWYTFSDGSKGYVKGGKLVTGWMDLDGAKYWFGDDGVMAVGWTDLTVDGKTMHYYFRPSGNLARGAWADIDGKKYYFRASGNMATGWADIDGKKYFFDDEGQMLTGWRDIDNGAGATNHYYFRPSGSMATGWAQIDGATYYFRPSGNMATGFTDVTDDAYKRYFDQSGRMLTGWQEIGGQTYYFRSSGAMQTGEATIGNVRYIFSDKGVLVG